VAQHDERVPGKIIIIHPFRVSQGALACKLRNERILLETFPKIRRLIVRIGCQ
jgi:hypothetical protein